MSPKIRISLAVLAALATSCGAWWMAASNAEKAHLPVMVKVGEKSSLPISQPTVAPSAAVILPAVAATTANQVSSDAVTDAKTEITQVQVDPPRELQGFWSWSNSERLNKVTSLNADSSLPVEVVKFLRLAVQNRSLDATTRNNIANALTNQTNSDRTLAQLFAEMSQDPREEHRWRDYALQHMGNSVRFSERPDDAVALLWKMTAQGERGIQGTSLMQLHRLEQAHVIVLDDNRYATALIDAMTDAKRELTVRMTSIGIVGERKEKRALPAVRLLANDADRSIRRMAIAALGGIGEPADREAVAAASSDKDPGIKAAAVGALRRLDMAQQKIKQSDDGKQPEAANPGSF